MRKTLSLTLVLSALLGIPSDASAANVLCLTSTGQLITAGKCNAKKGETLVTVATLKGETGAQGSQGPKGDTGEPGTPGAKGDTQLQISSEHAANFKWTQLSGVMRLETLKILNQT